MLKDLSHVYLSGEKFPMKMDFIVLQQIQKEYGTIGEFELKLIGAEKVVDEDGKTKIVKKAEPNIETINFVLPKMILEGLEIENVEHAYTEKRLVQLIDMNIYVTADMIQQELAKALRVSLEKKENPSQRKAKKPKKNLLTLIGRIYSEWRNLG